MGDLSRSMVPRNSRIIAGLRTLLAFTDIMTR